MTVNIGYDRKDFISVSQIRDGEAMIVAPRVSNENLQQSVPVHAASPHKMYSYILFFREKCTKCTNAKSSPFMWLT